MAKGFEQNQERVRALAALGKDLARRARSKCELSGASGVPLMAYEIPPTPDEPLLEHTLFVSEVVLHQLQQPARIRADEWRHLADLVWSDLPAVQVMALRILHFLAPRHPWAGEVLSETQPDPDIEEWALSSPL